MTCEEIEEISGAYALDAVTLTERQAIEAHLATCARCTQLLQELRGVVSLLPLSVPQVQPAATLESRILAAVQLESQDRSVPSPLQQESQDRSVPSPLQRPQPSPPIPIRRPVRQRPSWRPGALIAAAVLLLCLVGGLTAWNVSLHGQVATLQQQLAQATAKHPTQTPSGVTSYQVKGTTPGQNATGQLVYFEQQNITVLIIHGLPQLQGTHVYQGWLLHLSGSTITGVTSVGLLNPLNGTATLSFAGNVTGYNAAAVSLEPGPTATPNAPKGHVVALSSL